MLRTDPGWSTTRGGSFRSFSALFEHFKMPILRHLWAEGGPTKMNGRTTPEPRTENTWETVLRVKRELRNTFLSIFFRPNSIIRALRAPFPTAPRRARSQHARPRYSSPPSRSSATICVNHGLGAYQNITGVLFRVRAGAVRRMKCLRSTRARSP